MKSNKLLILFVFLVFLLCFSFFNQTVIISKEMITIFLDTIFPTLLPFFLCVYLLLETGILEIFSYFLQYISIPLFRINGYGCLVIITSIICGAPFSSFLLSSLYKKEKLSLEETKVLSFSTIYPSWSFMYLTIGKLLSFQEAKVICLSIYLSSFLLLFLLSLSLKTKKVPFIEIKCNFIHNYLSFSFPKALKQTIINCLTNISIILGTMVYFSIPLVLINKINNGFLLQSLFEFSSSTLNIIKSDLINKPLYLVITLSFGSLSLLIQHHTMLENKDIKFASLLLSRFFTVPVSILFLSLLT